jgi:hypothetical protein
MSLRINHYGDIVEPGSPAYSCSEPMLRSVDYTQPPLTAEEERQSDLARAMYLVANEPIWIMQARAKSMLLDARAVEDAKRRRQETLAHEAMLIKMRGGSR